MIRGASYCAIFGTVLYALAINGFAHDSGNMSGQFAKHLGLSEMAANVSCMELVSQMRLMGVGL